MRDLTFKKRAFALRRRGYSYNLISKKLSISKGTLSEWFSKLTWSETLKRDLTKKAFLKVYPQLRAMSEARSRMWKKWREEARYEAKNEFKKHEADPLFVAGVMLYWGEGDRNPQNPVRLSNVDYRLLRLFVKFIRKYTNLPKEKIKAHIILYPDLDEIECMKYWSEGIGIAPEYFNKTQHIKGHHKTRRLGHGIGAVEIGSRQLKEKILQWIELCAKI